MRACSAHCSSLPVGVIQTQSLGQSRRTGAMLPVSYHVRLLGRLSAAGASRLSRRCGLGYLPPFVKRPLACSHAGAAWAARPGPTQSTVWDLLTFWAAWPATGRSTPAPPSCCAAPGQTRTRWRCAQRRVRHVQARDQNVCAWAQLAEGSRRGSSSKQGT